MAFVFIDKQEANIKLLAFQKASFYLIEMEKTYNFRLLRPLSNIIAIND